MPKLKIGHNLNKGDYILFDFDRTAHQVIKHKESNIPRILLKLHYIVYDNSNSEEYVKFIKKIYLLYDCITRYIMDTGTDPETFYEFFLGLLCHFFVNINPIFIL